MFLPGIPGGAPIFADDSDGDGYDDDSGDYIGSGYDPDADDDDDGLTNEDETFGFEVQVAYETPFFDETTGEEYTQTEYFPEWVYTDPNDADSDDDLLPDGYELLFGLHPMDPADGNSDADGDNVSRGREYVENTNPNNPNTDGDSLDDGEEIYLFLSDPNDPNDPPADDGTSAGGDTGAGAGAGAGGDGGGGGGSTTDGPGSDGAGSNTNDPGQNSSGNEANENNPENGAETSGDSGPTLEIRGAGYSGSRAPRSDPTDGFWMRNDLIEYNGGDLDYATAVAQAASDAGFDVYVDYSGEFVVEMFNHFSERWIEVETSFVEAPDELSDPADADRFIVIRREDFYVEPEEAVTDPSWTATHWIEGPVWNPSVMEHGDQTAMLSTFQSNLGIAKTGEGVRRSAAGVSAWTIYDHGEPDIGGEGGEENYVRLVMPEGTTAATEIQRSFLKVSRADNDNDGEDELERFEVVQLTIAIGEEESDEITLNASSLLTGMDATASVSLLPVEIVVPKTDSEGNEISNELIATDRLKVGKMEGAISELRKLNIDDDVDRFYVKIPGGASLGSVTLKVGTTDNPSGDYDDDPTEMELTVEGDDLVTPSMLLVSDEGDDDYLENGVGEDDKKNDRTHLVQLGGKLHLTGIAIGDKQYTINHKVEVPAEYELDLKVIFLDAAATMQQEFSDYLRIIGERYAQVGVKVTISEDTGTLPEDVNPQDVQHEHNGLVMIGSAPAWKVNPEVKEIVDHAKAEQLSRGSGFGSITVLIVPNMAGEERGKAYTKKGTAPIDRDAYSKVVLLSAADIIAGELGYTPAHEVGHVLTDNFHYGTLSTEREYGNPQWEREIAVNLMRGTGTSSTAGPAVNMGASKRLYKLQEEMLLKEVLTELP